jgi:hypothetical protein
MKNLIFLFSFLITVFTYGQNSIYHPFPDSNACWNYGYYPGQCQFGDSQEFYSIMFTGDTSINNQNYHKLNTPFVLFYTSGTCTQDNIPGYKGAIRQEIPNKKVYYIPPMSSTEYLLYDFNLDIGDTVSSYIAPFDSYDTVISIDSVLVGDNFRKRWYINDWYEIYYIEGVGSTYGLIQHSPGYVTDAPSYSLDCFLLEEQSLYPDTNANCQLITSIKKIDAFSDQVKVFPNPSKGSFSVEFNQPIDIREIYLTDLVGNIVFQKEINNEKQVNIDNLRGGTYILTIMHRNNSTAKRKIISCP